MISRVQFLTMLAVPLLGACAAQTLYKDVPVGQLSDNQLVQELQSAAAGLGIELDRTTYLMAIRPEPAYVLTSSTTMYTGSASATYNAYVMPTGYGAYVSGTAAGSASGSATTRYQYTDVNASARLGNAIGTAISRARQENYRRRGLEVYEEYQRRAEARRAEAESLIQEFFDSNPDLRGRQNLVAVVAPWAAAEGYQDGRETLRRTKELIGQLARGDGLSGAWYGTFSQTSTGQDGSVVAFSEFVRLTLQQEGSHVTGSGTLGSGEVIELDGELSDHDLAAMVANTTSAINVKLNAIVASNQITGGFSGFGGGVRMEGNFTLLR